MAVNLSFIGGAGWQFFGNNGDPLSGGRIYTYAAGTTTPQDTYTSRSGAVPNTNPIILDAAGRTPEQIWSTEGLLYKYVIADANNVIIRTWDNIGGSEVASDLAQDLANTSNITKGDALVGFKQANDTDTFPGAVASTVHSKLRDSVSTRDFGAVCDGVTNDAASLIAALATGKRVFVVKGSFFSFDVPQATAFIEGLNRVSPEENTDFNLPGSTVPISGFVDVYNPDAVRIRIIGENIASLNVSAVSLIGGTYPSQSVQYSLSDATNVNVNDYLLISSSAGTGNYKVVEGCFRVLAKSGSNVTVKHTMNAAWPTAAFTLSSAVCYPLKTILRWPLNSAGLRVAGGAIGQISNLVLAGSFDIASGAPSDSPGDGLQVGSAPNTFATGLTESEQINAGAVWASRTGFVEWQGNGVQVAGGNFYGTLVSACANGWRGFQAARCGSAEAKFSSSVGNGASGYQSEGMGWMNADASVANGNRQQGYYSIGGGSILVGRGHGLYNQTGVDIRNFSVGVCDQAYIRNNTAYGLNCISGFIVFGINASTASNGIYDITVTEGGVINATGGSSIGATKNIAFDSGSRVIKTDGELIYPDENFLENSNGEKVSFTVTSITDLVIGFSTTAGGPFTNRTVIKADGIVFPSVDGGPTLGRAANRWAEVFAVNGTINTSDAREKQQVRDLTVVERAVAQRLKPLIKAYKFTSAVERKGDGARVHFGVLAQEVQQAFESEGLDASKYGLFCYDEWPEELEITEPVRDREGNPTGEMQVVQAYRPAGNRYGVRYDELLMFMMAAL